MKFTIKHYYNFGKKSNSIGKSLLQKEAWDAIRMDNTDTPFSIPNDRETYIRRAAESKEILERANAITNIIKDLDIKRIFSIGVGCAYLEFNIKQLRPDIELICTDFTPYAIDRLSDVFIECDKIQLFDMTKENLSVSSDTMVLMNRIDTELDNTEWSKVFNNMYNNQVSNLMVIATEFITIRKVLIECRNVIIKHLGSNITFAGYIRTKARFKELWKPYYDITSEIKVGNLTGFILNKRL